MGTVHQYLAVILRSYGKDDDDHSMLEETCQQANIKAVIVEVKVQLFKTFKNEYISLKQS